MPSHRSPERAALGRGQVMEVRVKAGRSPLLLRSLSLDADRASATLLLSGECQFCSEYH